MVCLAQTSSLPWPGRADQRADAAALVRQQVEREGVVPEGDVRRLPGAGDDGPHDLVAGGVAEGMDDAAMAVAAFARQGELAVFLVELRAPADQVVDLLRRLADDHLDDCRGRTARRRRSSVSSMWFSKRSSGDSTPAMPPWA